MSRTPLRAILCISISVLSVALIFIMLARLEMKLLSALSDEEFQSSLIDRISAAAGVDITFSKLQFDPLRGIDITDLRIAGRDAKLEKPLLGAERFLLSYDLSGITSGTLTILKLHLQGSELNLSLKEGEPKRGHPKGEIPWLKLTWIPLALKIDDLAVTKTDVNVSKGNAAFSLKDVQLQSAGLIHSAKLHLDLSATSGPLVRSSRAKGDRSDEGPPPALPGEGLERICGGLEARVEVRPDGAFSFHVKGGMKINDPGPLLSPLFPAGEPSLSLTGRVDLVRETAQVLELTLDRLLFSGEIKGILSRPTAHLKASSGPFLLADYEPLLRRFLPTLKAEGGISIQELSLEGPLFSYEGSPLNISGVMKLEGIEITYPEQGLGLFGLDGAVILDGLSLERFRPISLKANSGIFIKEVKYREVSFTEVSDDIQLSMGKGGMQDITLHSYTISPLVSVATADGDLLRSNLAAASTVEGDIFRGDFKSLRVDLTIGEAIRSELYGWVRRLGSEGLLLKNRLAVDLSKIEPLLSPSLLERIGSVSVSGTLVSDSTLSGILSLMPGPPAQLETVATLHEATIEGGPFSVSGVHADLTFMAGYSYPTGVHSPALTADMNISSAEFRRGEISDLRMNLRTSAPDLNPQTISEGVPTPLYAKLLLTSGGAKGLKGGIKLRSAKGELDAEALIKDLRTIFNPSVRGGLTLQGIAAKGAVIKSGEITFQALTDGPVTGGEPLKVDSKLEVTLHDMRHKGSGSSIKKADGAFDMKGAYAPQGSALTIESRGNVKLLTLSLPGGLASGRFDLRLRGDLTGSLRDDNGLELVAKAEIGADSIKREAPPMSAEGVDGEITLRSRAGKGFIIADPALDGRIDIDNLTLPTGLSMKKPRINLNAGVSGSLFSDGGSPLRAAAELLIPEAQQGPSGITAADVEAKVEMTAALLPGAQLTSPDLRSTLRVEKVSSQTGMNIQGINLETLWRSEGVLRWGEPLKFDAEAELKADALEYEAARLHAEGISSEIDITGSWDWSSNIPLPILNGQLRVRNLSAAEGLSIEEIGADLDLRSEEVITKLRISLSGSMGQLAYSNPQLEYRQGPVPFDLSILADTEGSTISLTNVEIRLPSLTSLKGAGGIDMARRRFDARLDADHIDVQGIAALLPGRLRGLISLPEAPKLAAASLAAEGSLPQGEISWADLPVSAEMNLIIEGLDLNLVRLEMGFKGLNAALKAEYGEGEVMLGGEVGAAQLVSAALPEGSLRDVLYDFRLSLGKDGSLHIERSRLQIPDRGLKAEVGGSLDISPLISEAEKGSIAARMLKDSEADLKAHLIIAAEKERLEKGGMAWSGKADLLVNVGMLGGESLEVNGALQLDDLSLSLGSSLAAEQISGAIPFSKRMLISEAGGEGEKREPKPSKYTTVPPQGGRLLRDEAFSRLLRPYISDGHTVKVKGMKAMRVPLKDVDLRISLKEEGLAVDRFQLTALGGPVTGSLFVETVEGRHHIYFRSEFAGINTAALAGPSSTLDEASEIAGSAVLNMTFAGEGGTEVPEIELELNLHKIGDKALERVLIFMDPAGSNPTVASARKALRLAAPSKEAYIRIKGGNLSFDLTLKAGVLAGATIKLPVVDRIPVNRLLRFSQMRGTLDRLLLVGRALSTLSAQEIMVGSNGILSLR